MLRTPLAQIGTGRKGFSSLRSHGMTGNEGSRHLLAEGIRYFSLTDLSGHDEGPDEIPMTGGMPSQADITALMIVGRSAGERQTRGIADNPTAGRTRKRRQRVMAILPAQSAGNYFTGDGEPEARRTNAGLTSAFVDDC